LLRKGSVFAGLNDRSVSNMIKLAVCLTALVSLTVNGQSDSIEKASYKSWIITCTKPIEHVGILYHLADSTIMILKSNPASIHKGNAEFESFNVESICKIRLRKKFNVGRGLFVGFMASLILGTISNVALLSDGFDPKYIVGNTVFLTTIGVSIGAIIGSLKIKIPLNGNYDTYKTYRVKLNRYSKLSSN